jgi:hypothetical protein
MAQRGRKGSKGPLNVVPLMPGKREPPPADLGEEERALWDSIVGVARRDWYNPAMAPLLRAYVSECVTSAFLERKLRELPTAMIGHIFV